MDFNKQMEYFKVLAKAEKVEIYNGLEGYSNPLIKRIQINKTPIKQIINGEIVAKFHKRTDYLVNEIIAQRAAKGLEMKNLIRQEDKHLQIEVSNSTTLKETRLLPAGFQMDGMIAIFGDFVTITSLSDSEAFGIIINDKIIATTFNSIFDTIWGVCEKI